MITYRARKVFWCKSTLGQGFHWSFSISPTEGGGGGNFKILRGSTKYEYPPYPQQQVTGNFSGFRGVSKKSMKLNWNFQRGGEGEGEGAKPQKTL